MRKRESPGTNAAETDKPPAYTCNEYRQEMVLLALRRKLLLSDLTEEERRRLAEEVSRLEQELGM